MTAELTDRELATRALVLAALLERVRTADAAVRAELKERMTVGDRVQGVLDPADRDTKLGTVTMAEGSEYVGINDPAAFFAWVSENHPGQIEMVPKVRPAFEKAVLDAVKRDGGWVDPMTSSVEDVPGVQKTVGDPKPVVKKNDDAVRLVTEALRAGKLKELGA